MIERTSNYGRHLIKKFLKQSVPYSNVLDICAGNGTDLSIAIEVDPSCVLHALEYYPPSVSSLVSKGTKVQVVIAGTTSP